MNCYCDSLEEIQGFGGYGHFQSTLNVMNNNVINEYFIKIYEGTDRINYKCTNCMQLWSLGIPDFPVVGYLMRKDQDDFEKILEQEFSEEAWKNLHNYYLKEYMNLDENLKKYADAFSIPEDIKQILLCKFGNGLEEWLNTSVPGFGGRRPVELLVNDIKLKILKAGIMRMLE
ncbi:antitoxin Xre/MbcA/ParS toxin-binding domain-containing protein [Cohnella terricola]|uniref:DUF2384 domain-containing protein n=1 Tax=Cohnella terricola TaxID=1289167 RepID=A0A559IUV0_9BACL|nr:antitoxin Xre/MbcA/ParS toxin-binding domain-containing protein [Cohnella terricola]TVX91388.1 DUF2384 domain-containing protein [Cohnella terricola]